MSNNLDDLESLIDQTDGLVAGLEGELSEEVLFNQLLQGEASTSAVGTPHQQNPQVATKPEPSRPNSVVGKKRQAPGTLPPNTFPSSNPFVFPSFPNLQLPSFYPQFTYTFNNAAMNNLKQNPTSKTPVPNVSNTTSNSFAAASAFAAIVTNQMKKATTLPNSQQQTLLTKSQMIPFPTSTKNLIDVTAKINPKKNWPKFLGELPAQLLVQQNQVLFQNILNGKTENNNEQEENCEDNIEEYLMTDCKFRCFVSSQSTNILVFGPPKQDVYFGQLQHDYQFLSHLLKTKTILISLNFKTSTSENPLPVSLCIYIPKKTFTVDPTLDEASNHLKDDEDDEREGFGSSIDDPHSFQKKQLKSMFDRLEKINRDNDDSDIEDDDEFLESLEPDNGIHNGSNKRRRKDGYKDVSDSKEENIDEWDEFADDEDLAEYIDIDSKEMEEESKKIHFNYQLSKIYDNISQTIEEDDDTKAHANRTKQLNGDIRQPEQLATELRYYQKIALKWMLNREQHGKVETGKEKLHPLYQEKQLPDGQKFYYNALNGILTFKFIPAPPDPKGGILADEMGLGKTLEIISLIVGNKCRHESRLTQQTHCDKNNKILCKATLVVTPLTIAEQWKTEIERHTRPSLKVYIYQGGRRIKDAKKLLSYDVIITTYNTLSVEYSNLCQNKKKQDECPMFSLHFHRIVLDEAHNIKNRKSLTAKAATALEADRRWAVTGTPIQNHIDDLFALFKFMHVHPHGDWRWWSKYIGKPFEKKEKKAVDALQNVVSELIIRRTKNKKINGEKIVQLPPKKVEVRKLKFNSAEESFYRNLYTYFKGKFDEFVQTNTVMKNYANILEMLLHLRLVCGHPALLLNSYVRKKVDKQTMKNFLENFSKGSSREICDRILPMLPSVLKEDDLDILSQLSTNKGWRGSSKIDALVKHLHSIKETTKSVVFSQWTSMLDIVEIALQRGAIKYVRLDGSMSRKERDTAIQKFRDEPMSVCLISLKAGGTGLNLVWATHVFLMDPWWNPAVEEQAIDRVHRIGQAKAVTVIRYIIEGSVEERIMRLQETKTEIAENALGPTNNESVSVTPGLTKHDQQKIRMEDLRVLFDDGTQKYSTNQEDFDAFTDDIEYLDDEDDDDDDDFHNSLE